MSYIFKYGSKFTQAPPSQSSCTLCIVGNFLSLQLSSVYGLMQVAILTNVGVDCSYKIWCTINKFTMAMSIVSSTYLFT